MQVGETSEVFLHPIDTFAAEFLGIGDSTCGVSSRPGNIVQITTPSGLASVAALHPEAIIVSQEPSASGARNRLRGTVREIVPYGSMVRVILDVGIPLMAVLTRENCRELDLEAGCRAYATLHRLST